ncbi:MAG: glycosyltransferase family 2 protein [Eubacterium sp.]|nr:glycosyltransferase family 2 protein [Eubacterium sp.]
MSENILFSIIIPVYNTGKYLNRCFDSVLSQTFKNWEVIIVDDGSTDKTTIQICDEYARRDSRFKVFHKKNEGLLLTRVYGREHACGQYFCTLDSDDYWHHKLLEKVNHVIIQSECDVVLFRYRRKGTRRNAASPKLFKNGEVITPNEIKKIIYHLFTDSHLNNLCLKVVKASLMKDEDNMSSFADVIYGEDLLQSVPVLLKAKKIYYLNKILYYYCNNPKSITRKPADDEKYWMQYNNSVKIYTEILRLLKIYIRNEEIYLYLYYKCLFIIRLTYAKGYMAFQKDDEKRKRYLTAVLDDNIIQTAKVYINERDFKFRERILCKKLKEGTLIDWMLKNEG